MARAMQDRPEVKKPPPSEFHVGVAEPDDETGAQHIEIRADCYVQSVPELYDMLQEFATRVAHDVESGKWRNA